MNNLLGSLRSFAAEDAGAQIIEYALIIAVVSVMIVISLRDLTGSNFSGFTNRVDVCLLSSKCV